MSEKTTSQSTLNIYNGYIQRYESWCLKNDCDPASVKSLRNYASALRDKYSPQYLKNVINVIRRKWFTADTTILNCNKRKNTRWNKCFTPEQLEILRNRCLLNYEQDELSLWILLLLDTELRTRDLPKLNNYEYRRNFAEKRLPTADAKTKYLYEFLLTPGNGPLFPKRHNTYLARFKRRVSKEFSVEYGGSFEMLKRSLVRLKDE